MTTIDMTPVRIPIGTRWLEGDLDAPDGTEAMIAFACTNGSSRLNPRDRRVAEVLAEACLGTLVLDLLTPADDDEEDREAASRVDIDLSTRRLLAATDWLLEQPGTRHLPIGYFGRGVGTAAAIRAAAERPAIVGAVASEEGRPDLAGDALLRVRAPVLLLVPGEDEASIRLHEEAVALIAAPKRLRIVPGATDLLEEPAALEQAAHLARNWFAEHLVRRPACART